MKRLLFSLLILFGTVALAQELPNIPDDKIETLQFNFRGQWLPSSDPTQIGPENYRVLQNLRYTPAGTLESVGGYTKINTTVITSTPEVDQGFHFKKDNPAETHVLVNADGIVYQNTTTIPSAGDFSGTALHTDASGAGNPRFSNAPRGNVAYANGVESMIWGGNEMPVGAFITSTVAVTNTVTNPKDYSIFVNNDLTGIKNVAIIGGGNDAQTQLLAHFDGTDNDAGDYTSEDDNTHTMGTVNDAKLDTAQKKFGLSSMYFDGTADYISVPDDDGVSDYWFWNAQVFTMDAWYRFEDISGDRGLFEQRDGVDDWVYFFWDQSEGDLVFTIRDGGVDTVILTGTFVPVVDTWYHIAVHKGWTTGAGSVRTITVDGVVLVTVDDASVWPELNSDLVIGKSDQGDFHGWIDEFRMTRGSVHWIAPFTPWERPYTEASRTWLIGSPRPIQGVKFYLDEVNSKGSALTVQEWNGTAWVFVSNFADNTDTGPSLAQDGTVTWDSTVDTSKVKFMENRLLYWYQFVLNGGNATIYRVTLDAPWQDIVDIWDGVYRQPIQFQAYKSAKYEDYTVEVNDPLSVYYGDLGGMTNAEWLVLMFNDRTTALQFTMVGGKENAQAATATVYYWNGTDWADVGPIADTTLGGGGESLGQSGAISWDAPSIETEFQKTQFGTTGFGYKIVWSATLTASNSQVNTVYGIPAQLPVHPFKFTATYRDRLLLLGYTAGGEGNRVDYSLTHAPQTFNGEETSNGGLYSLYFGGEEELTAGAQLYNRMGSNLFIFFVALKESETYILTGDGPDNFKISQVSQNVGCPAPASLITAEMGFDIAADVQRHIAAWVSYTGPIIFDGAVIYPVPGLENYFDKNHDDYLGQTAIVDTIGFFDQDHGEYNIIIGSKWFAYNLRQKRWFSKSTGTAETPISAWPVRDTYGNQYVYAGLDNGFVMRLEYGTSWNGTGITQRVQTGDFWPTKNVWDVTEIRRIKLAVRRIANPNGLQVVHYANSDERAVSDFAWINNSVWKWKNTSASRWDNGTSILSMNLSGLDTTNRSRVIRITGPVNLTAESHSVRFEATLNDNEKGFQPLYWAIEYMKIRRAH